MVLGVNSSYFLGSLTQLAETKISVDSIVSNDVLKMT